MNGLNGLTANRNVPSTANGTAQLQASASTAPTNSNGLSMHASATATSTPSIPSTAAAISNSNLPMMSASSLSNMSPPSSVPVSTDARVPVKASCGLTSGTHGNQFQRAGSMFGEGPSRPFTAGGRGAISMSHSNMNGNIDSDLHEDSNGSANGASYEQESTRQNGTMLSNEIPETEQSAIGSTVFGSNHHNHRRANQNISYHNHHEYGTSKKELLITEANNTHHSEHAIQNGNMDVTCSDGGVALGSRNGLMVDIENTATTSTATIRQVPPIGPGFRNGYGNRDGPGLHGETSENGMANGFELHAVNELGLGTTNGDVVDVNGNRGSHMDGNTDVHVNGFNLNLNLNHRDEVEENTAASVMRGGRALGSGSTMNGSCPNFTRIYGFFAMLFDPTKSTSVFSAIRSSEFSALDWEIVKLLVRNLETNVANTAFRQQLAATYEQQQRSRVQLQQQEQLQQEQMQLRTGESEGLPSPEQ